jgi:hypothetical protein
MPADRMAEFWPGALGSRLCALSEAETEELQGSLRCRDLSPGSAVLRRLGHRAAHVVSPRVHAGLTTVAKAVRRAVHGGRRSTPVAPLARLAPEVRPWAGRRAAVLLTHDLDGPACAAAIQVVLAQEVTRQVSSVVHLLAAGGYDVSPGWIDALRAQGAEIGVHGVTHDYAIGTRPAAAIRAHLARALDALRPVRPVFYRAPAFAVSARLVTELDGAGFQADSSRTVFHPAYRSTRSLLPYRLRPDLWELPVAIEDSWLLRDWRLSVPDAIAYCDEAVRQAIETGGVVTIDTHPSLLARVPDLYPALLDRWLARGDVWIAPPREFLALCDALCAA